MLFGKKKKQDPAKRPATIREAIAHETEEEVEITEAEVDQTDGDLLTTAEEPPGDLPDARPSETIESGEVPKDFSQIESKKGYIDFGAVLVPASKHQKVRLDIDQKTKRVVSLTIAVGQSSIQVQAFSAPKSGGIWDDVRGQIEQSVIKQKGRVKHVDGRFGKELHARVPTVLKDGRKGLRAARFIGFEGKRWFLRGVIGGRGALDSTAAEGVEELFSKIVVVRGDDPLPPRELLRLTPPAGAKRVVAQARKPAAAEGSAPQKANRTNGVRSQSQPPEQPK